MDQLGGGGGLAVDYSLNKFSSAFARKEIEWKEQRVFTFFHGFRVLLLINDVRTVVLSDTVRYGDYFLKIFLFKNIKIIFYLF